MYIRLITCPHTDQNPHEIATIASSTAGILVADINGNIYLLDRVFDIARTWIAHVAGRITHMVENKGILVTLGVSICPSNQIPTLNTSSRRKKMLSDTRYSKSGTWRLLTKKQTPLGFCAPQRSRTQPVHTPYRRLLFPPPWLISQLALLTAPSSSIGTSTSLYSPVPIRSPHYQSLAWSTNHPRIPLLV